MVEATQTLWWRVQKLKVVFRDCSEPSCVSAPGPCFKKLGKGTERVEAIAQRVAMVIRSDSRICSYFQVLHDRQILKHHIRLLMLSLHRAPVE
jgi:hypothetical protein